jgi:lipoprotein-anchoring transpeptidase ErfK/SrfK
VRSRRVIIAAAAAALLLFAAVGAFAYDHSRRDTIAHGVHVAGVDVGGMGRAQASTTLRRRLLPALRHPVVVAFAGRRFTLGAKQAGVAIDLDGALDAALTRSRDGLFVSRVAREVTGGKVEADVQPAVVFSRPAVRHFAADVAAKLDRAPRDATIAFTATSLSPVAAQQGVRVQERRLRLDVVRALETVGASRTVHVRAHTVAPKVTSAQLADAYDTVITVDRTNFRLRLWKRLKLVKSYPIAVGRVGLETPAGLYHIQDKQIDPSWHVPNSAWAGDLAGKVIPPGPDDPIKARWMGIFDGAGIHGTDELSSLGSAASHGCVRMAVPDVIDLYDRVPVGAAVYIA